jgi:hypothetical protein
MKKLVHGQQQAGVDRIVLDGRTMAGGRYVYRLQAPGFSRSRKLLLLI